MYETCPKIIMNGFKITYTFTKVTLDKKKKPRQVVFKLPVLNLFKLLHIYLISFAVLLRKNLRLAIRKDNVLMP